MIVLFFLVLSIIVSYAMGGRLRNLSRLSLRLGILVIIALLLKLSLLVLGYPFNGSAPPIALLAHTLTYMLMAAFLLANLHLDGIKIVTFGLALSFASVFSNNSFTLKTESAHASMSSAGPATAGGTLYPFADMFSLGSLLVGFGVFLMISRLLLTQEEQVSPVRIRYQPRHLAKKDYMSIALRRIV